MSSIDTSFKVAPLPGQNRSQDEYRLPGSHPASGESNPDATGPGAEAPVPPAPHARAARKLPGRHAGDAPADGPGPRHAKAAPKPEPAAPVRITGKVFALRDGSGYAALGSDGKYYRVDGGAGHGLAYARAGGFVDASMVNVAGGPVSAVQLDAGRAPVQGTGAGAADPVPQAAAPSGAGAPPASPEASLADPEHAASRSHAARELIAGHPRTAMRSQANVPPRNAISLLR